MWKAALILCLLAMTLLHAESERLDLKGLQQLYQQAKWSDLVAHLADIPPSDRNHEWRELVEKSALGYLKALQADGTDTDVISADLLRNFAVLRFSKAFMDARDEAGLHDLERCYADYGEDCLPRVEQFLKEEPTNAALALETAKIVAHHGKLISALPFFAKALTESTKNAVCQEETFQTAWVAGMSTNVEPALGQAETLAVDYCWPALKETLTNSLESTTAKDLMKNGCRFLKKHGSLDASTKQKCDAL